MGQRTPLPASEFAQIDLSAIPEASTAPAVPAEHSLALPGDLPPLGSSDSPDSVWTNFRMIEPTPLSTDPVTPAPASTAIGGDAVPNTGLVDLEHTFDATHDGQDVATGLPAGVSAVSGATDEHPVVDRTPPETPAAFHAVPSERIEDPPAVHRGMLVGGARRR